MEDRGDQSATGEARRMLELFGSAGATRFDVTWTDADGNKQRFRRGVPLADLSRSLPAILDHAERHRHNVIVRPDGPGTSFIQLDDLPSDKLPAISPPVFLMLQTSPGNFQAWVAVPGLEDKELARRLRRGTGADATASGATRIAGSLNFKAKYVPAFPRVAIHAAQPGKVTSAAELEGLGLLAAREIAPAPLKAGRQRLGEGKRRWPSYEQCVDGAPENSEKTGPDISRADFVWCMTAITWGWSVSDTATRLMEESAKAQTNGQAYADLTARNAALAVERRQQRPRMG